MGRAGISCAIATGRATRGCSRKDSGAGARTGTGSGMRAGSGTGTSMAAGAVSIAETATASGEACTCGGAMGSGSGTGSRADAPSRSRTGSTMSSGSARLSGSNSSDGASTIRERASAARSSKLARIESRETGACATSADTLSCPARARSNASMACAGAGSTWNPGVTDSVPGRDGACAPASVTGSSGGRSWASSAAGAHSPITRGASRADEGFDDGERAIASLDDKKPRPSLFARLEATRVSTKYTSARSSRTAAPARMSSRVSTVRPCCRGSGTGDRATRPSPNRDRVRRLAAAGRSDRGPSGRERT